MKSEVTRLAAAPAPAGHKKLMGEILVQWGKLTLDDVDEVLRFQKEKKVRFGEAAQRLRLITRNDIKRVLSDQFDYPYLMPGIGPYPPELVAAYEPFSADVEAYRSLRNQLFLRWFAADRTALAVVSTDPDNGTSLLTANLGVLFSQLGEPTLIIDANLRQPRQHQIFNLEGQKGLSDVLAGHAGVEVIAELESFGNLSVLPSGPLPPNPLDLISRGGFTQLMGALTTRFRVILIDVPAFSLAADALTIAARVHGVLMVVVKHKSRVRDVNVITEQFKRTGVEVVGSVMVEM